MRRIFAALALAFVTLPAAGQAPGERSAVISSDCDYQCLIGFARGYMGALAKKDPTAVRFARNARFTENNVEMPIGNDGLWATVTSVPPDGLEAADVTSGYAAWIGAVEEHGLPVYFGMRLRVQDREIAEVETIVVRTTGLPLPFGDTRKLVHDPSFAQPLQPEQRRPRERLVAVADSYFDTVELNDGQVFADFTDDCSRIENGILTTSSGNQSSGNVAQGCEAQFRLGIYRINKRIRERRYTLVDEERGVVVATGFFDHANTFDRYKLTDGRELKTLLKWPNSISLVEAFKIVDGKISRIEAVFTYVPYFMPSPFYTHPKPPVSSRTPATGAAECDRDCLTGMADRYIEAMLKQQPGALPWAHTVRFTENSVALMIGDGLWGSIRGKAEKGVHVADVETGNVAWYGIIYDHDAPAYLGLRLKVADGKISEVESVVARARNPGPFGEPKEFKPGAALSQALPASQRAARERLTAIAGGYSSTMQLNDGTLFTQFDPNCTRIENGAAVTDGEGGSAVIVKGAAKLARGCEAQLKLGLYRPIDRVRDRRTPIVDAERGLVVSFSFADSAVRSTRYAAADGRTLDTQDKYPSSRELFEIFRIRNGRIERIEAIAVFQPYRMPSPWKVE